MELTSTTSTESSGEVQALKKRAFYDGDEEVNITVAVVEEESKKHKNLSRSLLRHEGITLTFGDCAENHAGMQMLGERADHGFSKADLMEIGKAYPDQTVELIELHKALTSKTGEELPEAYVLVVRNAIEVSSKDELLHEIRGLAWDKMAKMRGKVVNKHARYNLCFDWFDQEADYESGKGTVVNIENLPCLRRLYERISLFPNSSDLKVEGNYYYDLRECGIGFHGDSERAKVIGIRLGGSYPLHYRWYKSGEAVSNPLSIVLNHGDLYVMSEKAVGQDWKRKLVPTLRHAAGAKKYTGLDA